MKPLVFLLVAPPVGLAVGAGIGVVICFAHAWRMERRLRKDWG